MALYLSEIVSVGGRPGLHKLIGKRNNGLILETLDGTKKRFPTSVTQKVSFLSDISMYTYEGDAKLADVLTSLHEKVEGGLALVSKKSSGAEVQKFFREVLKDFDEDQVYNSDILKLVSWYGLVKDLVDFKKLENDEEDDKKTKAAKTAQKPKTTAGVKNAPKAQSRAKGGVKKSGNLKSGKS